MKKIALVALVVILAFSLAACSVFEETTSEPVTKANLYDSIVNTGVRANTRTLVKGEIPKASDTSKVDESAMYEMPSIEGYTTDVNGNGDVNVEIFIPLEDMESKLREVMKVAAQQFNSAGYKLADSDKSVSVSLRALESKLAEEYVINGVYNPEGYIAANELYGVLMQENGVLVSMVTPKTISNTMGIAIVKAKYDELLQQYGKVDIDTIVKANIDGKLSVGYSNPTNNPSGLNFVVSMLNYFDANNPMSVEATTDFSRFQNTVSMVSYSTTQMKQAVYGGRMDAFTVERQTYENDGAMKNDFVYMPFGVRHDNPLYAVGNISEEEKEVLRLFGEFMNSDAIKAAATTVGFGKDEEYVSKVYAKQYSGILSDILSFWKQGKSAGKQIVMVFVADTSGSMAGNKINALRNSMLNAMQYISENNKVGLVSYASSVYVALPIGEFNTTQQEYYVGAVKNLIADGNTATNNALVYATRMILDEMKVNPNVKPMIILLSDGYTQSGLSLSKVRDILDVSDIPIYTIGYQADVKELSTIAEINGGAFINADSEDVGYILKTLFDAEM